MQGGGLEQTGDCVAGAADMRHICRQQMVGKRHMAVWRDGQWLAAVARGLPRRWTWRIWCQQWQRGRQGVVKWKFVIRSDLRCIYNDHINERLQEDFGNGNGVNKDMRQELGLAASTEKSSQPSWRQPGRCCELWCLRHPLRKWGSTWWSRKRRKQRNRNYVCKMVIIYSNSDTTDDTTTLFAKF